jgi:PleD family two-component response regulator
MFRKEIAMSEIKKHSILIVDDENANIMTLTHILGMSYTIYAVKDGESAIEAAKKHSPDVILLDVLMEGMSGFDVIAILKGSEETRNIPVIFITALSDPDDEEKGFVMGASDYITKPFSPAIVKIRVLNQIKLVEQMKTIIEKEVSEKNTLDKIDFLSKMSHDMMTPMNAILGFTYLLKNSCDESDPQKKEYLEETDKSACDLLKMLNRLLEMSGGVAENQQQV